MAQEYQTYTNTPVRDTVQWFDVDEQRPASGHGTVVKMEREASDSETVDVHTSRQ
ncbi:unknown (plasmid) [Haloarcula marismortui ATCC 43049]|uniref:Uncharacterized protein n=1 Tax=Haloarcula marismortui (strain ATCC 43049 / DSM 3752 / JCM 8966 / VKM B-1809) TaxID=272569 RepID=Q5V5W7_HALMA|nr:unknown [Haloarcula marismortui ATCC 43049]